MLNQALAMKYPKEHKTIVREKLLDHASMQIRTKGVNQISVKSVMESQGMTVGGFYAHFKSKQELIEAAIERAFDLSLGGFYQAIDGKPNEEWLDSIIESYLSKAHTSNIELGCPAASLMGDMARSDDSTRTIFETQLERMFKIHQKHISSKESREISIALFSLFSGGLQLSRAVNSKKKALEILTSCKNTAKALVLGHLQS